VLLAWLITPCIAVRQPIAKVIGMAKFGPPPWPRNLQADLIILGIYRPNCVAGVTTHANPFFAALLGGHVPENSNSGA